MRGDGWSGRRVTELNRYVVARDGGRCWHPGCQRPGDTTDHTPVPKVELPVEEWFNPARCRACCRWHNTQDGAALGGRRLAARRSVVYAGASRDW